MVRNKLRTEINKNIFFAKYWLYRRDCLRAYRELLRNQSLSRDELDRLNWEKRRSLLAYAYEKVPFYRKRFSQLGLHPQDIKQPEDYQIIPVFSKEELRSGFHELFSEDAKPGLLRQCTTGGSTGVPVKVMVDKRIPAEAFGWRMMDWWQITPSEDAAFVWRMFRKKRITRAILKAAWWPSRRIHLDASSLSEENVSEFISKFNKLKPGLLQGYTGAIAYLAMHIENNSLEVFSPKAIWVTSSPITQSQRIHIEKVFRCPVYDQYGCGEVFWLAAECSQRAGLHMFHDGRFIEFLDDKGRVKPCGQTGQIVITDLENYLFPIIRYANGDMGRAIESKCPCGVNLPLMDKVRGRIVDLVKLPDETCISGEYLTTIFDDYPSAVKGFQVKQEADYSIAIRYVPGIDAKELDKILSNVRTTLERDTKSQVPISFEAVDSIANDRGKLQFIISEVDTFIGANSR